MGSSVSKAHRVSRRDSWRQRTKIIKALKNSELASQQHVDSSVSFMSTSEAWESLKSGDTASCEKLPKVTLRISDFRRIRREKTVDIENDKPIHIDYEFDDKVLTDELCHICSVYTGSETYPCRICSKVYHESCLRKIGQCQDPAAIALLNNCNAQVGWSCHECDNLNNLLTEEELFTLIEGFEKHSIKKDVSMTQNEFLNYRQQRYKEHFGTDISKENIEDEIFHFKQIDRSKTNSINWWDFVNFESARVMQKRSKNALVRLLTPKEVNLIRRTFRFFDPDNIGEVTEKGAQNAFLSWYSHFLKPGQNNYVQGDTTEALQMHVRENAQIVMDADEDKNGTVTWDEYIRDQAIYILAARPNNMSLPIGKRRIARYIPSEDLLHP